MILINLEDWKSTAEAYPRLRKALEWLVQRDRQGEFTVHREELSDGAYAKFERPAMRIRERAHLEVHRIYIDIHVPLSDDESIGWAPTRCCRRVLTEYDHAKDIAFYGDDAHSMIRVRVGDAAVFFPEDAHAPNIGVGYHKKITVKIPID